MLRSIHRIPLEVVFIKHQGWGLLCDLASEAVQGAALALESVYHVKSSDSLAAGVLSVGHSVTDDILKEDLQSV